MVLLCDTIKYANYLVIETSPYILVNPNRIDINLEKLIEIFIIKKINLNKPEFIVSQTEIELYC